jgi:hypothetical protein
MRSRYYDPDLARFLSEDPLGLGGGINPYVYAGNDPINATDPFGLSECPENGCMLDVVEVTARSDEARDGASHHPSDRGGRPWANGPTGAGPGGGTASGPPPAPSLPKWLLRKPSAATLKKYCSLAKYIPGTVYGGANLNLFYFVGFSGSGGIYVRGTEWGYYVRGGWGYGLDISAGGEVGANIGGLSGVSGELAVGVGPLGSKAGVSVSVGFPPNASVSGTYGYSALPVNGHADIGYTRQFPQGSCPSQ